MRLRLVAAVVAVGCVVPAAAAAAEPGPATAPVTFALLGDTPYGDAQRAAFPALVDAVNADPRVRFVLHAGDIKTGSSTCDDARFADLSALYNTFADPFVLTPGDNEWTDCHRTAAGGYLPTERLEALRRVFYPRAGLTTGGHPMPVLSQALDPRHRPYRENVLFHRNRVVFATVHVVGSNNDLDPWAQLPGGDRPEERLAEFAARQAAALDWIDTAFAAAQRTRAAGVLLMMQAEPTDTPGFAAVRARITALARTFGKPVLLVHGDEHVYEVEPGYAGVPNLTRLETFGDTATQWLRVTADAGTASVFSWQPLSLSDDLGQVRAQAETAPNFDDEAGGLADADDPAIWVHPSAPERSVVVGTLKNGGLTVVDLAGRELQRIPAPPPPAPGTEAGRFNNVDIVQGARIGGRTMDLAVVSDRGRDRLRIFSIDRHGTLTEVTTSAPALLFSADEAEVEDQRTGYGLAVWPDPAGGAPWVVVSRRHETRLGLFRLDADPTGKIEYRRFGQVDLPATFPVAGGTWTPCAEPGELPQVEGMVTDRETNVLYAAQEDVGIWRIPLSRSGFGRPELVERVREFGQSAVFDEQTEECVPTGPPSAEAGQHLSADAEGLTIADRTLLASSQGDSTFATYRIERSGLRHTGGFRVHSGQFTDSVEHSDGAAVTTAPLGPAFPFGLLVVHDGENTPAVPGPDGEPRPNTNFKLLRWDQGRGTG